MATTRITISGPLFDGTADRAAADFTAELVREVAEIGKTWIQLDTQRMDKSGRSTGAAADGVKLTGAGTSYVISGGIEQGKFSWPWLEGTSKRNQGSTFKGYKTFSRTRLRMRKQVTVYAQELMDKFLLRMGGA